MSQRACSAEGLWPRNVRATISSVNALSRAYNGRLLKQVSAIVCHASASKSYSMSSVIGAFLAPRDSLQRGGAFVGAVPDKPGEGDSVVADYPLEAVTMAVNAVAERQDAGERPAVQDVGAAFGLKECK